MSKKLFNDSWYFARQELGISIEGIKQRDIVWHEVEIPHDWLIYDVKNLYQAGEGWYKKEFIYEKKENKVVRIYFEGVYMDSTLYVNGYLAGSWTYGYSSFEYDISSYLVDGKNELLMSVKYESPNTRWYSGAGIYRNIYLKETSNLYFESDGIYISADAERGIVHIDGLLGGNQLIDKDFYVNLKVTDKDNMMVSCKKYTPEILNTGGLGFHSELIVKDITSWDIDNPYLYTLEAELLVGDIALDSESVHFGFRTFLFNPNEGFFLNGRGMKLKGVCLHHDLGSLGAAVNKYALNRQLLIMKDMGVNAIRTTHNMPAVELMELCDELGILVVSEAYDMWESPKTEFDNARFFKETWKRDVKSWVTRDRNHPSLIMWSIGNEIHDTHASLRGLLVATMLKEEVQTYDYRNNGVVTIGSNYIAWENAKKVADYLTYSGYNYGEHLYDLHHEKYPHWIIYGSETASTVKSRGIYHFPAKTPILTHDDMQCSSMDNSAVGWGAKNAEWGWTMDRDRKFCAGQFIWTGFDYIGEPTPYNTKNSYFGIVDTAGLKKDIYYMYQAEWIDYRVNPMVHLLPYWDFNEGQLIDVFAYTNGCKVELFLNGKSLGTQGINHETGQILHGAWRVEYAPGILQVKAYDINDQVIATDEKSSFKDITRLVLTPEKSVLKADGRDLCFLEITGVDEEGQFVANARNRVNVEITGAGRLIGLDNGDSTDYEDYKTNSRRLFSGKLIAVIESTKEAGDINIKVSSRGIDAESLLIESLAIEVNKGISVVTPNPYHGIIKESSIDQQEEIPVRKIELSIKQGGKHLDKELNIAVVSAKILPEDATYSDLTWKLVNNSGVEITNAELEVQANQVVLKAIEDGECRLRCMCNNGGEIPQIISELEFNITGLKSPSHDPYTYTSACFYNKSNVPLNVVKNGAVSGFFEKTVIGFTGVEFGKNGSSVLELYIGNSGGNAVPIEIWDGFAGEEGAKLLVTIDFQLNGQWDGFLPETFKLPKTLKGKKTISFVVADKIIFGGFQFIERNRAYENINAGSFDRIYGDSYVICNEKVENIGNNVVLEFTDLKFIDKGFTKIIIKGKTPTEKNSIHVRFTDKKENKVNQLIEFPSTKVYTEIEFNLESVTGRQDVSFVFLPGSNFDFEWFKFE
ncbi:MAG: glycoside hydrolase family 2 sugar binding protein [Anaerocolumna sp.]|nr:glycoside hydrolase family 2 sugar binding protein [Anaerocolumna sp.]